MSKLTNSGKNQIMISPVVQRAHWLESKVSNWHQTGLNTYNACVSVKSYKNATCGPLSFQFLHVWGVINQTSIFIAQAFVW